MITAEQIPPEVVEAAAKTLAGSAQKNLMAWEAHASATIAAGLAAWPGVNEAEVETPDGSKWLQSIILPLSTEGRDE
jgi:hypothetical protein